MESDPTYLSKETMDLLSKFEQIKQQRKSQFQKINTSPRDHVLSKSMDK